MITKVRRFAFNEYRRRLYQNAVTGLRLFLSHPDVRGKVKNVFITGSYLSTSKQEPKDIDFLVIPIRRLSIDEALAMGAVADRLRIVYKVDLKFSESGTSEVSKEQKRRWTSDIIQVKNPGNKITKEDIKFIKEVLIPFAKVDRLYIAWSRSKATWPDIWVTMNRIPKITVTQEWARQNIHERRKRLVHEGLHLRGLEHNESIGYSTFPAHDSYSKKVYRRLISR